MVVRQGYNQRGHVLQTVGILLSGTVFFEEQNELAPRIFFSFANTDSGILD
jgi:hypothetical protein